jgi:iron complex outermembrane recepter protein
MNSNRMPRKLPRFVLANIALALSFAASAQTADRRADATDEQSLEDLMRVEVTSVSKKPQKMANVASAVFVITAEDIKLSGSNSIAEALQMAPGMSVVRVSADRWGVNARGYADRFANKLLVMVDGRNAYSPSFSGVTWEDFQFPLEDVARIEVIRGPAAAIWGTNGVNGVINIITKSASSTQGGQVVIGGGNTEGGYGRVRWGGASDSNDLFYRGYASFQQGKSFKKLTGADGEDAGKHTAVGGRIDGYLPGNARWDVSADILQRSADGGRDFLLPGVTLRTGESHDQQVLRGRYQRGFESGAELQVQSSVAHGDLYVGPLNYKSTTFDLDAQYRTRFGERQDVVAGVNYRYSTDNIPSVPPIATITERYRTLNYISAFVQDEIAVTDTLKLTLAMRIDSSDLTHTEKQPSARLSWNMTPSQTVWGSVSRAARTPSRGELGLTLNFLTANVPSPTGFPAPPATVPVFSTITVIPDFESESLNVLELGWRAQWSPRLSTDLTLYAHRYTDLRSTIITGFAPVFAPQPPTVAAIQTTGIVTNEGEMTTYGAELSSEWRVDPSLRLQLATWFSTVRTFRISDSSTWIPKNASSFRASWAPRADINADLWVRYMSGRINGNVAPEHQRRAATTVDARVAWRMSKAWELALIGKNLTDSACDVYKGIEQIALEASRLVPTCAGRGIAAEVRADF